MAVTKSVSFRDDERHLLEWVEDSADKGDYRSESALIIEAIKEKREKEQDTLT